MLFDIPEPGVPWTRRETRLNLALYRETYHDTTDIVGRGVLKLWARVQIGSMESALHIVNDNSAMPRIAWDMLYKRWHEAELLGFGIEIVRTDAVSLAKHKKMVEWLYTADEKMLANRPRDDSSYY